MDVSVVQPGFEPQTTGFFNFCNLQEGSEHLPGCRLCVKMEFGALYLYAQINSKRLFSLSQSLTIKSEDQLE